MAEKSELRVEGKTKKPGRGKKNTGSRERRAEWQLESGELKLFMVKYMRLVDNDNEIKSHTGR